MHQESSSLCLVAAPSSMHVSVMLECLLVRSIKGGTKIVQLVAEAATIHSPFQPPPRGVAIALTSSHSRHSQFHLYHPICSTQYSRHTYTHHHYKALRPPSDTLAGRSLGHAYLASQRHPIIHPSRSTMAATTSSAATPALPIPPLTPTKAGPSTPRLRSSPRQVAAGPSRSSLTPLRSSQPPSSPSRAKREPTANGTAAPPPIPDQPQYLQPAELYVSTHGHKSLLTSQLPVKQWSRRAIHPSILPPRP